MKKLTAVLLVLMLALAMMPTVALAETGVVNIANSAELMAAITNQQAGQTWNIAAGTYDITAPNATITLGAQTGWYFPIVYNDITINGAGIGKTIITSSFACANGSWASQDFISVWGDNITVQNITIRPKLETNKAIEIMGKNVMLKNIEILHNNCVTLEQYATAIGKTQELAKESYIEGTTGFAGSVYFLPQNATMDIGNAVLDNVQVLQAWISCRTDAVYAGTLTLQGGTTIDFRGSAYAGVAGFGVISSNPSIIKAVGFRVIYDDKANIADQINSRVPTGTTLIEDGSTLVTAGVEPTYTIIIPAVVNFGALQKNTGNKVMEFNVIAKDVVIESGKQISVKVNSEFKLVSGANELAYSLFNVKVDGTPLATGAVFAAFDINTVADAVIKQEGRVVVNTANITAAGAYSDVMTFTIEYVPAA